MENTETGTPIQYMKWNKKGHWDIMPAVIASVSHSVVSVTIIGKKQNTHIAKATHADFRQKGKDYWDFIEGEYQLHNKLYPWINPDGKLQVLTYEVASQHT